MAWRFDHICTITCPWCSPATTIMFRAVRCRSSSMRLARRPSTAPNICLPPSSAVALQPCDHYPTFFAKHFQPDADFVVQPRLRQLTSQVVRRWGLPADVDPQSLVERGLMNQIRAAHKIPRWINPGDGRPVANEDAFRA